jgi:hypothetical protein
MRQVSGTRGNLRGSALWVSPGASLVPASLMADAEAHPTNVQLGRRFLGGVGMVRRTERR